jgi:hypothetical protein
MLEKSKFMLRSLLTVHGPTRVPGLKQGLELYPATILPPPNLENNLAALQLGHNKQVFVAL